MGTNDPSPTARATLDALLTVPPDQRPARLRLNSASDAVLLTELRHLLTVGETSISPSEAASLCDAIDRLLDGPTDWPSDASQSAEPMASQVGAYSVLEKIGEGGMGRVYRARQHKPDRLVALKVIAAGLTSPASLRRFDAESEILGRLSHPGIAQIYEAGSADLGAGPQPYFAMELVDGGRMLTRYAAEANLDTRARVSLMIDVCDAVEHAHQKGVIHRDLKPDNILVSPGGQIKVLDFGIARLTNADVNATLVRVELGKLVGTVRYMSPEQTRGDPLLVDTRSDVYSLGVILYELLSGRVPHVGGRLTFETIRSIREDDPPPLSSHDRGLRGDLDTIVARSLEKDPSRRYQSAGAMADDLRRFLADEPIQARPSGTWYQLRKFSRRNRGLVIGVAAAFVALAGGLAAALYSLTAASASARVAHSTLEDSLNLIKTMFGPRDQVVQGLQAFQDAAAARGDPMLHASADEAAGIAFWSLRMLDKAEASFRSALQTRERLAPLDVKTIDSRLQLGAVLRDQAKLDEARALLEQACAEYERRLGPDDQNTIAALATLARLHVDRDDHAQSLALYTDLAGRADRAFGPEHAQTLMIKHNLADCLIQADRPTDAAAILNEVLRIQTATDDGGRAFTLQTLGNLELKRGNRDAACEKLRASRDLLIQMLGPDADFTKRVESTLRSAGCDGATDSK